MSRTKALLLLSVLVTGCATTGVRPGATVSAETGVASYVSSKYHGHATSSGEIYDERRMTAAHRTLAFGTRVRVTNLANRRTVVLTITDRGPFRAGRIIDVSRRAAIELGFLAQGTTRVRVAIVRG